MVDSDAEEQEQECPQSSTEWDKIHSPLSQPTIPPLNSCSLVSIRDHSLKQDEDPIIFPPSNHENLHFYTPHIPITKPLQNFHHQSIQLYSLPFIDPEGDVQSPSSSYSSSDCFSPSDDNSPPQSPVKSVRPSAEMPKCGWWMLGMDLLYAKINGVVMFFRNIRLNRVIFLTFKSPEATMALILAFLYFRRRRRAAANLRAEGSEHLRQVIKEKDERISQLLNQIARMNEVLLAMHKVHVSKNG